MKYGSEKVSGIYTLQKKSNILSSSLTELIIIMSISNYPRQQLLLFLSTRASEFNHFDLIQPLADITFYYEASVLNKMAYTAARNPLFSSWKRSECRLSRSLGRLKK